MAITINGTGSITGLTAGGLPDGSITTDDLAANAVTAAKLAAGAGGKILQVVQAVKTSEQSSSSTTYIQITGLNASITPSSSSNKILISVQISSEIYTGYNSSFFRLSRGGTAISGALGNDSGDSNEECSFADTGTNSTNDKAMRTVGTTYLDSPASTSSLTYGVQWKVYNSNTSYANYINGPYDRDGSGYRARTISTITLMEVAE